MKLKQHKRVDYPWATTGRTAVGVILLALFGMAMAYISVNYGPFLP